MKALAALAILSALAGLPAAAACPIEIRVENRGSGALEILPEAWDSGVRLIEDEDAPADRPGGFPDWEAGTTLEPGESVAAPAPPDGADCAARRLFQMAYRCLAEDAKGVAFAPWPPAGAEEDRATIPLTRCE